MQDMVTSPQRSLYEFSFTTLSLRAANLFLVGNPAWDSVTGERKKFHSPLVKDGLWKAEKIKISYPKGDDAIPHISIDKEVYSAWTNSVVLKVLGKPVSYAIMERRVRQMWNLKGRMTLRDLPNHYFVARFELEEDFLYVLTEGPWMIFGNYISTRQWDPLFSPDSDVVNSTYVWVRLSGLSMVLYGIAAAIGSPVKVDVNTLNATRGKFARICVEIDITQPLLGAMIVEGGKIFIDYDGLHTVCYRCGVYGHLVDRCTLPTPDVSPPKDNPSHSTADPQNNTLVPVAAQCPGSKRGVGGWSVVTPKPRHGQYLVKKTDLALGFASKNSFGDLGNLRQEDSVELCNPIASNIVKEISVPIAKENLMDLGEQRSLQNEARSVDAQTPTVVLHSSQQPAFVHKSGSLVSSCNTNMEVDVQNVRMSSDISMIHEEPSNFSKGFRRTCQYMLNRFRIDILALLEPQVAGVKAHALCDSLGFIDNFRVEAVGSSGSVWLLWNASSIDVQIV
ncbi:hypothetical protein V2J09_006651 [Rumex salicifolius]